MKKIFLYLFAVAFIVTVSIAAIKHALSAVKVLSGDVLYGISSGGILYKIDPINCTICPVATLTGFSNGAQDLLVLPNGDILLQTGSGLYLYQLPDTDPIWSNTEQYRGSIIGDNGIIYLSQLSPTAGLSTFDPATNNTVFIGAWPANMSVSEFFYQNGVLYAVATLSPGGPVIIEVNLNDPSQSTIVQSNSPLSGSGGTTNNGYTTTITSSKLLYQYNVATNTADLVCDFSSLLPGGGINGLSELPVGVVDAPCQCVTFAGTVNNQTFNICVPGSVTVPYNNNATLDANDILRYILFSDPADTLGSIIVQSSSPVIAFNPATMQTGVTYYLATIAGNNAGGNVDFDDPCLDISNTAAQVVWRPLPTVAFSIGNPDLCAGECRTVTATFTGMPPFSLTYTTPFGTFTQTFAGSTGTFQVCALAGAPLGTLTVQATALTDEWCVCQ